MNDKEPKPPAGVPDFPDWLDGDGRREWMTVIPILQRMRVLTEADYKAVAMFCDLCARYRQARAVIAEHGNSVTIVDDDGNFKSYRVRAEVGICDRLAPQIRNYAADFGLNPASRTRIKVDDDSEPVDSIAEHNERVRRAREA